LIGDDRDPVAQADFTGFVLAVRVVVAENIAMDIAGEEFTAGIRLDQVGPGSMELMNG
jgi:hypothetical protein